MNNSWADCSMVEYTLEHCRGANGYVEYENNSAYGMAIKCKMAFFVVVVVLVFGVVFVVWSSVQIRAFNSAEHLMTCDFETANCGPFDTRSGSIKSDNRRFGKRESESIFL